MEEAIEWVRRCPDPMPGEESEIEIRQVFEAEDFDAPRPKEQLQETGAGTRSNHGFVP